jgi:hypothetical protein
MSIGLGEIAHTASLVLIKLKISKKFLLICQGYTQREICIKYNKNINKYYKIYIFLLLKEF